MKYYVYYTDDYPGNGGEGLEEFDTEAAAAKFIEERMSQDSSRTIDYYTVIRGEEMKIEAVETVTKIRINKSG